MNRTLLKVILVAFTILLLSPIDFLPGMPVDDILYAVGDIIILMILQRIGWRDPARRSGAKPGGQTITIRPESAESRRDEDASETKE